MKLTKIPDNIYSELVAIDKTYGVFASDIRNIAERNGVLYSDIYVLWLRIGKIHTYGASQLLRNEILQRDNYTCQYCGGAASVVDHVIPVALDGRAEEKNLVAACEKCNWKKTDHVWIPFNIDVITRGNEIYRNAIINMAQF